MINVNIYTYLFHPIHSFKRSEYMVGLSVLRPLKSMMQSNDLPASLTLDYYDICYVFVLSAAHGRAAWLGLFINDMKRPLTQKR